MKVTAAWRSSSLTRSPWGVTLQWGTTCFHGTSSYSRAATGGATRLDVPQGSSTLPANSLPLPLPGLTASLDNLPSYRTAQLWEDHLSATRQDIRQPLALPPLHHQNKDSTFLAHRRRKEMWFKEVKPWQCWALWVPEVPQICGSSGSDGAQCRYGMYQHIQLHCRHTQKPNLCELTSSQDDSFRC